MLIFLLAFAIGATTGFGHTVIALTFAGYLYPIDFLIPVIVPLNILICAYLAIRHRRDIDWQILAKKILPFALLGMPIGLIVFYTVQTAKLKIAFGVFVLSLSTLELVWAIRADKRTTLRPLTPIWSGLWLLGGGIIQGLWASGGPLIAYWAGRNIADKRVFRSTLTVLWLLLNAILLVCHAANGKLTLETARMSAILLPSLCGGIFLGEWFHDRLPEKSFRICVFSLLIIAGGSIILSGS
jgi:uncharacterized protein